MLTNAVYVTGYFIVCPIYTKIYFCNLVCGFNSDRYPSDFTLSLIMPCNSKPGCQPAAYEWQKQFQNQKGQTGPQQWLPWWTISELESGIKSLKPGKAIGLDRISTEEIIHFGTAAKTWLLTLFNSCLETYNLPKIWKKAHVLALLKPGKKPDDPKSFRPISLLCHPYKLFERLILNRISADIDKLLILLESMLSNRMFIVELNGKKSRWRRLNNGLPQGSVLAPLLFNIYTNDQPSAEGTNCYLYADDLAIALQDREFSKVETTLTGLTQYYIDNSLRVNPAKTQACAFHLRNKEAKRTLNIKWNGQNIEHCSHPVYLGVTLDRTLSYKQHVEKTRCKANTRVNILKGRGVCCGGCMSPR
jgi:hypothetical protein